MSWRGFRQRGEGHRWLRLAQPHKFREELAASTSGLRRSGGAGRARWECYACAGRRTKSSRRPALVSITRTYVMPDERCQAAAAKPPDSCKGALAEGLEGKSNRAFD